MISYKYTFQLKMHTMENIIIASSHTGELSINFEQVLKVKNKRIALLSIIHSGIRQRSKRLIKDKSYGDTALFYCDVIKDNTIINNSHQNCLDVVFLNELGDSTEIRNPTYHDLRVNELMNINIEIRGFDGELFNFSQYVIVKLALK